MNLLNKELIEKAAPVVTVSDEDLMMHMMEFDAAMEELNEKDNQVEALVTSLEQLIAVSEHVVEFGVTPELISLYGDDLETIGIEEGTDARIAFETLDNMLMANGLDLCDAFDVSDEEICEEYEIGEEGLDDRFETVLAKSTLNKRRKPKKGKGKGNSGNPKSKPVPKGTPAPAPAPAPAPKGTPKLSRMDKQIAKVTNTPTKQGMISKATGATKKAVSKAGTSVANTAKKIPGSGTISKYAGKAGKAGKAVGGTVLNAAMFASFTPWNLLSRGAAIAKHTLGNLRWGWIGIAVGIAAALATAVGTFVVLMKSAASKLKEKVKDSRVNGFQDFKNEHRSLAIEPANEFIKKIASCEAACKFIMNVDPAKAIKTDFNQKASLLTPLGYSMNTETGQFTKEKTSVPFVILAEHGWTEQNITTSMERVITLCLATKAMDRVAASFKNAIGKAKTDSGEEIPKEERSEAMRRVKEYKAFMKITMSEVGNVAKKTLALASKTVA